ncbi:hypothetical protein K504DRAFT_290694 [Pleomassaria siparia CBS 279.74]|uniref:Uncharacterized protein n=1 Tax=Pleomassaria siparia CBS 279.74 TaxID=1314801 RepID=A0A6G1K8C3_9PLEO|nr:hypothetical protein K504DRAFT_290694 [Pleomassaria siparia CBS 279.74]
MMGGIELRWTLLASTLLLLLWSLLEVLFAVSSLAANAVFDIQHTTLVEWAVGSGFGFAWMTEPQSHTDRPSIHTVDLSAWTSKCTRLLFFNGRYAALLQSVAFFQALLFYSLFPIPYSLPQVCLLLRQLLFIVASDCVVKHPRARLPHVLTTIRQRRRKKSNLSTRQSILRP